MYRSKNLPWRFAAVIFSLFFITMLSYGSGCSKPGTTNSEKPGTTADGGGGSNKDGVNEDCQSNDDCSAGLVCKEGKCVKEGGGGEEPECKTNGDCPPGKVCSSGVCKEEKVDPKVASVEIITPASALKEGATLQLEAVAYNKSGARLSGEHKFTWTSSNADVVAVDSNTGLATGGKKDGTADIVASLEGIKSKPLTLRNFAKVAAGKIRVIVRDEKGQPVSGATIKVGSKEGKTDSDGAVTVDGKAPFDLHVFHKDYSYFSAFGVKATDLFVQVTKNEDPTKAAGAKGKFDYRPIKKLLGISDDDWGVSNVALGIAGFSIGGNIMALDFTTLLGESFEYDLLGKKTKLPSGLVVDISGQGKPNYQAQGEPGRRVMWGLGGKFKLSELQPLIDAATQGGGINAGELLVKALPLFKKFVAGFISDVKIVAYAKVKDINDLNKNGKNDDLIPDFSKFPEKNIVLEHKLDQTVNVKLSNIPKVQHNGKDVKLYAIAMAGVQISGYGMVPLGLALGEAKNGSSLALNYAKPFGILQNGKFMVLTIVLTLPLGDNPPPLAVAGHVNFMKTPADISVSSFVGFGTKAKFDPASRKVSNAQMANSELQMVNITLKGKRWMVVFPAGKADVTLPAAPFDDRVSDGSEVSLFGVDLADGQTMDTLLEFNTINMDKIIEAVSGFSNVTIYKKK